MPELGLDSLPKELHPLGEAKPKTLFSMMIPEVVEGLQKSQIASVVIFGIEVRHDKEETSLLSPHRPLLLGIGAHPHRSGSRTSACCRLPSTASREASTFTSSQTQSRRAILRRSRSPSTGCDMLGQK